MSDEVVRRWATKPRNGLSEAGFVQADIDELIGFVPQYPAREALRLFRIVCEVVSGGAIPLLVLPLASTTSFTRTPPSLARELARRASSFDVPSFYLTAPQLWALPPEGEEYRLLVRETGPELAGFSCYFGLRRTAMEIANGWEYTRGFYIRPIGPSSPAEGVVSGG
jgi:hypothetical protein